MPILHVLMRAGRPRRVTRQLAERLTRVVVETLGAEPPAVRVLVHEVDGEDWYVGGKPLGKAKAGGTRRRR